MQPIISHPILAKYSKSLSLSNSDYTFSLDFTRTGNAVFCTGSVVFKDDYYSGSNSNHELLGSVPSAFVPFGSSSIHFRCAKLFLSIESDGKIYLFSKNARRDSSHYKAFGSWLTMGDNRPSYIEPRYNYYFNDYYNSCLQKSVSYKYDDNNDDTIQITFSRIGTLVHLNGICFDGAGYEPSFPLVNDFVPYGFRPFLPKLPKLTGCGVTGGIDYTTIQLTREYYLSDSDFSISGLWITADYA